MSNRWLCLTMSCGLLALASSATWAADTATTTVTPASTTTTAGKPATTTVTTVTSVAPAPADNTSANTSPTTPSESIKAEIDTYNKQLPTMIDNITQLNSVTLDGDSITYHLKVISYKASELDKKKFDDAIRPDLTKSVCTDPKISVLLKDGYTLTYVYNSKDDQLITQVPIAYKDCGDSVK